MAVNHWTGHQHSSIQALYRRFSRTTLPARSDNLVQLIFRIVGVTLIKNTCNIVQQSFGPDIGASNIGLGKIMEKIDFSFTFSCFTVNVLGFLFNIYQVRYNIIYGTAGEANILEFQAEIA
ncbi:unnamed protein product [Caenorhabditis nigoni]